jgi:hypothetical protein
MVGNVDPTGFYKGMRDNVAYPLLKQFGFDAAILVKTAAVFNPLTGTMSAPGTEFSFPCKALYGGTRKTNAGIEKKTKGTTLTRVTTKEVNIDATTLTIAPGTDDRFEDETGQTYEILSVSPISPGGLVIMWKITVVY